MLSIGKLGAGKAAYYLASVADGVEDYYTGAGQAPGRWLGGGAELLGLTGDVDGASLHAVLEGLEPTSGVALRERGGSVPGFDLTFRAPKSVSLLYALGAPTVSRQVREAHDQAVDAALV